MIIDPVYKLGSSLLTVEKPARYTGGEYGIVRKSRDTNFRIALSFPDLYEIGMSNYAIRILYTHLNNLEDVSCERVFAPAPDFEKLLRRKEIPLYSLENGISLKDFDLLAFTVGYELSATGILSVLDTGGIPLHAGDRSETDPIVVAGGSAVTNPVPLSLFLDAVFIGEAEAEWIDLVKEMSAMKKKGSSRSEQLAFLRTSPYIWFPGKLESTFRAVWTDFSCNAFKQQFPLPGLTAVQDHGVVEIMRGCPNGCRFCHAGIIYRPHREKEIMLIEEEAEWLFNHYGYKEITLSSLSTGDYSQLLPLINRLTSRYSKKNVSFSLPSLRVNSFTLPIINKISEVRKSGLTFAVETPELLGQKGLNKEVPVEKIIEILRQAKEYGWRNAKFYFMQGLPTDTPESSNAIIDYLEEIRKATNVRIHLTVNTFIPKPHTPFERSFQLSENDALEKIYDIKRSLKRNLYKFGFHSPFASVLEGVISRGDARVGNVIEKAYFSGARLDAWEEYLNRDLWREILEKEEWNPLNEAVRPRSEDEKLPWDNIDIGVRKNFLNKENKRSQAAELTLPCDVSCNHNCGACDEEKSVVPALSEDSDAQKNENFEVEKVSAIDFKPVVFSFTKKDAARYLSHKNLVGIFQRLFTRKDINLRYTEGFNPKPKMEFANPLSLGVASDHEVAMIYLPDDIMDVAAVLNDCNDSLPDGMQITGAEYMDFPAKIKSIMAYYHGSEYRLTVPFTNNKEITVLFKDYLTEPETAGNDIIYRFYYPDGRNEVKGISRIIRDNSPELIEKVDLVRIKTFFSEQDTATDPFSLPHSSVNP